MDDDAVSLESSYPSVNRRPFPKIQKRRDLSAAMPVDEVRRLYGTDVRFPKTRSKANILSDDVVSDDDQPVVAETPQATNTMSLFAFPKNETPAPQQPQGVLYEECYRWLASLSTFNEDVESTLIELVKRTGVDDGKAAIMTLSDLAMKEIAACSTTNPWIDPTPAAHQTLRASIYLAAMSVLMKVFTDVPDFKLIRNA